MHIKELWCQECFASIIYAFPHSGLNAGLHFLAPLLLGSTLQQVLAKDLSHFWASLVAQWKRTCLSMQKSWIRFLGWEDTLEKKWQPTPVFLPGKFHGQRSLAGYSPWGRKQLDTTWWLSTHARNVAFRPEQ